jgi:hypothetical protein
MYDGRHQTKASCVGHREIKACLGSFQGQGQRRWLIKRPCATGLHVNDKAGVVCREMGMQLE